MIIRVTAKHIKEGRRGDSCRCPLALAFKDAGFDVLVSCVIRNRNTFPRTSTRNTRRSVAFIKAFDAERPVKPTVFRFKEFA